MCANAHVEQVRASLSGIRIQVFWLPNVPVASEESPDYGHVLTTAALEGPQAKLCHS